MIRPWPLKKSTKIADYRIFTLRSDEKESPRTGQIHDFFVLEGANWVNVLAITPDHQLVMVEQFRHGTNTVELEIPGGMIDSSDANPVEAGERELREETGYAGMNARILCEVFPNPAIMNNTCYTVLVENCHLEHPLHWDQGEDLLTKLVPLSQVHSLLTSGVIKHSLVAVALYHFELIERASAR